MCVVVLSLAAGVPCDLRAAGRGEPGPIYEVRVPLTDRIADLAIFHALDLDIDGVFYDWARLYVIQEEIVKLHDLGYTPEILRRNDVLHRPSTDRTDPTESLTGAEAVASTYHTYLTLTQDLQQIATDHPDITRLISIGQSVQGREMWMMKISRNPDLDEDEPEFAFLSSMHGDEVVGKELCYNLIETLTTNDGIDPRITAMIDTTEIWIMPSFNPDGTERGWRYNNNFIDLNRDFPDQFNDPVNTITGRAIETQNVMLWRADRRLTLSANYHGGALVANYPFDSNDAGSSIYSPSPDDTSFVAISRIYADNNPPMATSNSNTSFFNGITNGADWYAINGGMQDWHYVWYGGFDLTLEVSNTKWPAGSTLPGYWDDNLESMLSYIEASQEGLRGVVTDATTGLPLDATVTVNGNPFPTRTDPDLGDWHQFLMPGRYSMEISAPGYITKTIDVDCTAGAAARYDTALQPAGPAFRVLAACSDPEVACDSFLAPGGNDLSVTLRNLGVGQNGITGTIETTGWNATVTRTDAGFPDLPADQTGTSNTPHYAVNVEGSAPVGHKLGFVVRWNGDQGSGTSDPFFLPVDTESCTSASAIGLPLPITDRNTITNALELTTALELTRLEVTVDVLHSYRSDLALTLVSPNGTRLRLHDRSGGSQDNISGTYGVDLSSFEPFSRLMGESSAGFWTLEVEDGVPGNTGSLQSWSLNTCGRPFETTPPEMRLHTVAREAGGVRLTWFPYSGLTSYRVYRSTDPSAAGSFVDITASDDDSTDTTLLDVDPSPIFYYLVTGLGPNGEGPQ